MKDFNAIINAVTRATHSEAAEIEAIRALADNGETYASICRYFEDSNSAYVIYNNDAVARIIYNFDSDAYTYIEDYFNYMLDEVGYSEDYILNNVAIFDVTSIKFMTAAEIKDYTREIDEDSLECVDVQIRGGQLFFNFRDANWRELEEWYEYDSIETKKGSVLSLSDNYEALSKVVAYDKSYSAKEYADKLLKFFEKKKVLNYVTKLIAGDTHITLQNKALTSDTVLVAVRTWAQNMKYAYKIYSKSGDDLTIHIAHLIGAKLNAHNEILESGFGTCRLFQTQQKLEKAGINCKIEGVSLKKRGTHLPDCINYDNFKSIGLD